MKKCIKTTKAPSAIGPYSQATTLNGMVFTSGQIPINPENGELLSDISEATHQVMKNLEAVLIEAGSDFSHVVKTTIFLTDMNDFEVVNKVYASYFVNEDFPARETVAVKTLPKNAKVEISMIAFIT